MIFVAREYRIVVGCLAMVAVFTHFQRKHKSYRLGNEIDLWFSRNTSRRFYALLDSHVTGFVRYLHTLPPTSYRIRVAKFGPRMFLTYDYQTIIRHLPTFRRELTTAVTEYFGNGYDYYTKGQCVVHYRLGDFLANSDYGINIVTPEHIVSQIVELGPTSILLLDGGMKHTGLSKYSTKSFDLGRGEGIKRKVREMISHTGIPLRESTQSADDDFATIAFADFVVTGCGSYAITGAIANTTGEIRTPALGVLNPNDIKSEHDLRTDVIHVTDKWKTYPCRNVPPDLQ
jgi:hypothetical protein